MQFTGSVLLQIDGKKVGPLCVPYQPEVRYTMSQKKDETKSSESKPQLHTYGVRFMLKTEEQQKTFMMQVENWVHSMVQEGHPEYLQYLYIDYNNPKDRP